MDERELGVHASHCCVMHGCKYGEPDCPVTKEVVEQEYICEVCSDIEEIKSLKELKERLILDGEIHELKQKIEKYEREGKETIEIPIYLLKSLVKRHFEG